MRPAVRTGFRGFTEPLEGVCTWMYLDVKGLVTTGIGDLIDPLFSAQSLPWRRADGLPASRQEVEAAWHAVKSRMDLATQGGGAYRWLTSIRLSDEGVDDLVSRTLDHMDAHLTSRFGDAYAGAPADGQLCLLSLAWACGPAFAYPRFAAFVLDGNWDGAAHECDIANNPHRSAAQRTLAFNAARAPDPDILYWPRSLAVPSRPADQGALGPAGG